MNNPLLYTDPSGMSWFSDLWDGVTNANDWFWDTMDKSAQWLEETGISVNAGVGYNSAMEMYTESGGYRQYASSINSNVEGNFTDAMNSAREVYFNAKRISNGTLDWIDANVSYHSDLNVMVMFGFGAALELEGTVGVEALTNMDILYHRTVSRDGIDNDPVTSRYYSWDTKGPARKFTGYGASYSGYGLGWDVTHDGVLYRNEVHMTSFSFLTVFGANHIDDVDNENHTLFIGLKPAAKGGVGLVGNIYGSMGFNINLNNIGDLLDIFNGNIE
jgi:hypothetical protein